MNPTKSGSSIREANAQLKKEPTPLEAEPQQSREGSHPGRTADTDTATQDASNQPRLFDIKVVDPVTGQIFTIVSQRTIQELNTMLHRADITVIIGSDGFVMKASDENWLVTSCPTFGRRVFASLRANAKYTERDFIVPWTGQDTADAICAALEARSDDDGKPKPGAEQQTIQADTDIIDGGVLLRPARDILFDENIQDTEIRNHIWNRQRHHQMRTVQRRDQQALATQRRIFAPGVLASLREQAYQDHHVRQSHDAHAAYLGHPYATRQRLADLREDVERQRRMEREETEGIFRDLNLRGGWLYLEVKE